MCGAGDERHWRLGEFHFSASDFTSRSRAQCAVRGAQAWLHSGPCSGATDDSVTHLRTTVRSTCSLPSRPRPYRRRPSRGNKCRCCVTPSLSRIIRNSSPCRGRTLRSCLKRAEKDEKLRASATALGLTLQPRGYPVPMPDVGYLPSLPRHPPPAPPAPGDAWPAELRRRAPLARTRKT